MNSTPLFVGPDEIAALHALREQATAHPVDIQRVLQLLRTKKGKRQHMAQMTRQTLVLPVKFTVTFSIETGHPAGTCRHMSMASGNIERLPHPAAIWMVAEELGFVGELSDCAVWLEDLTQGKAVNLVQPIAIQTEGSRA